jgi:hypothetical protein
MLATSRHLREPGCTDTCVLGETLCCRQPRKPFVAVEGLGLRRGAPAMPRRIGLF